ncbi:MAG: GAF domain-containing protein [Deltaproteobacteria bacterium]|nr:GAF domain-containing protein [Deltaproteobacteria bacterium]
MTFKRLKLFHKALIALFVILLPIFIAFLTGYIKNKNHLEENILYELTETSNLYEALIYRFIDGIKERVEDFSSDGRIRTDLEKIINGKKGLSGPLGEYLSRNKLPLDNAISRICVISGSGVVVASTDSRKVGQDVSGEEFFIKGRESLSVAESYGTKEPEIVAVSPIYSLSTGKRLGMTANFILATTFNPTLEETETHALDIAHGVKPPERTMRQKRDVYIVNSRFSVIAAYAFSQDIIAGRRVETMPVKKCLAEKAEYTGYYAGDAGKDLVGASHCIPELGWALVVETEKSMALAPVQEILREGMAAAIISAGLIAAVFIVFLRAIITRLKRLSDAAIEISKGNYSATVPVDTEDEIGALSSSFNSMASEINSRARLLKEAAERLNAVINNSTAYIYLKGLDGRYLLVNSRFEGLVGIKAEKLIGLTDYDLFPYDTASSFRANDLKAVEAGKAVEFEEAAAQPEGIRHYISVKAPVRGPDGNTIAICGVSTDITERRRAEENIARLNRVYLMLSKINEAIIHIRDAEQLFYRACRIAVEEGGFMLAWIGLVDEALGAVRPAAQWGPAIPYLDNISISIKDIPVGRGPTGAAIRQGKTNICNDIEHDERMAPWRHEALKAGLKSSAAFPIFSGKKTIGSLNLYADEPFFFTDEEAGLIEGLTGDISFAIESMELEKEARQKEKALNLIQNIALSVSEAQDLKAALQVVVANICDATGWDFGEVWFPNEGNTALEYCGVCYYGSKEVFKGFADGSRKMAFAPGQGLPGRVWKTKRPEWIRAVAANGSVFLRAKDADKAGLKAGFAVPIAIAGGDALAVLAFFMTEEKDEDKRLVDFVSAAAAQLGPVIQRKRAEDKTFEERLKYEGLVNNLAVGVFRAAAEAPGRFMEANPALISMLDASSKEEFLRHSLGAFLSGKKPGEGFQEKLFRHGFVKNEEVEALTLKGRKVMLSASAVMKKDKSGVVFIDGVIEDITERKMLQGQLVQSQRMEAVGALSGGIAHDFNNIITAVAGYAHLLSMKAPGEGPSKEYSDHILTLTERAATLVQGLLAIGRKQVSSPQALDLNELIKRVEKILLRIIGEDIELKAMFSKAPLIVRADPAQIEQVLMNLATNARDAMPKGGVIAISTALVEPDRGFLKPRGLEAGKYALITFSDTGAGMDEDVKAHIFEPFFTTKEQGKGTGLGLSTVYGIIKQHSGAIEVFSKPKQGAIFMVYLPVAARASVHAGAKRIGAPKTGTETILFAEDEDEVRSIIKDILEDFGYTVIEAKDGAEAVEKFEAYKDRVRLLLFDVIMPKKTGPQALADIRRTRPDIKALFLSGYAGDRLEGIEAGQAELVQKPIAPTELLRKVREVLDR